MRKDSGTNNSSANRKCSASDKGVSNISFSIIHQDSANNIETQAKKAV